LCWHASPTLSPHSPPTLERGVPLLVAAPVGRGGSSRPPRNAAATLALSRPSDNAHTCLSPLPLPPSLQRSALAAQPAADAATRAGTAVHSNADEYARFAADPARKHVTWPKLLNASLAEVDPVLVDIIEKEKNRQWKVSEKKG
jgi:hypothetical protein